MWKWLFLVEFAFVFLALAHSDHAEKFVKAMPKDGVLPYAHSSRTEWNYIPMDRTGVSYQMMTPGQKEVADAFLKSFLSDSGWAKVGQIVQLESVLGKGLFSSYDPKRYFFAFFGEPQKKPWTLRFEGHHLSLNFTETEGGTFFTPFFWGANPARHDESGKPVEPMRAEQQLALQFVNGMASEQKKVAIISNEALSEIVLAPGEKVRNLTPKGIRFTALTPAQQKELLSLLQVYLDNFEEGIRNKYADVVLKNPSTIHFAWAGATRAGEGHYYRIQNESFIVEYDNTQNGANHIHTVWHDLKHNFGEDMLQAHYQESHQEMTVADVQTQNEGVLFPFCREALWMAKIELRPVAKHKSDLKRCSGEKTDEKEPPCFVLEKMKCLKGKCAALRGGADLRKFGIDATNHWFMPSYRVYLLQMPTKEMKWGVVPWDISAEHLADKCGVPAKK